VSNVESEPAGEVGRLIEPAVPSPRRVQRYGNDAIDAGKQFRAPLAHQAGE